MPNHAQEDPEVIVLHAVLNHLLTLEPIGQTRVMKYVQERLGIFIKTDLGDDDQDSVRPAITVKQLATPVGAIATCVIFVGMLATSVTGGGHLPYPINDYAELYRVLFPVVLTVTLRIAYDRNAFRFDRSILVLSFFLSCVLFVIFPVILFLVALPVVKTFPLDFRWSSLAIGLYWLIPIYGVQQTWYLLARPLKLTQSEAVLKGRSWWWWFSWVVFFMLPLFLLFAWLRYPDLNKFLIF